MWRSKARALLLRSSIRSYSPFQNQLAFETLTLIPPVPRWVPPTVFQNPRFFSSDVAPNPSVDSTESPDPSISASNWVGIDENDASNENPIWNLEETDVSSKSEDGVENVDAFGEIFQESGDSSLGFGEESVEIDVDQVNNVVSLLQSTPPDSIELSLEKLGLNLSEEFVSRVLQSSNVLFENLVGFFNWASGIEESVKSSRNLELLVLSISNYDEVSKKEAYVLWDLIKELGKEKGILNTGILNELISLFWKLGKAQAALEVYNKFEEFGCNADGNTYYYTVEALGKRSKFDTAWSVCQKMLDSGNFPDETKIGKIITFFCKGKRAKEAHLVYLVTKEKNISCLRSSLDFLICGLVRNDENVPLALELIDDYPEKSFKYANKTFGSVVKALCRIKKSEDAKKLLLRMVDCGPPPGNAVFNYVITALCKEGEVEEAITLMRSMDRRGLRPDVYTYSVVMSGFAKGGLMDEAYKIFCEAKKRHCKLSPVTYHILIRGYCKMEEFEKALECLKEMKEDEVKPNADEYDKMIQSLCLKRLDWRTAEKLLEEMKESGLYLKGTTRSLLAAVKELEEEETQSEGSKATA